MDGFELLARMTSDYPTVDTVVMTAYANEQNVDRLRMLNTLELIEKPVDFDELTQSILNHLHKFAKGGSISGISLPNFLDLIERECKTCLLEVRQEQHFQGLIYLYNGDIWDAYCGDLKGEPALFELLAMEEVKIILRELPARQIKRRVNRNLMYFLLQLAKREDEASSDNLSSDDESHEIRNAPDETVADTSGETLDLESESSDEASTERHDNQPEPLNGLDGQPEPLDNLDEKGVFQMAELEEILEKFRDIEGFMAVGVFSPQGEMVSQVNASGVKLEELGALANDVLLKAQKATEIMGVGRGQMVHIEAPKAQLIARCLNEATDFATTAEGRAHVHMVLALNQEGNLAMGKMKMTSIIQDVAQLFR